MRWGRKPKVVGTALLFALLATAGLALGGAVTVTLGQSGPLPANIAVSWGDTVTFSNTDSVEHGLLFTKRSPRSGTATTTSPTTTTTPTGTTPTTTTTPANIIPPGGAFVGVFDGQKGKYPYKELVTVKTKTGTKQKSFPGTVIVTVAGTITMKASPRSVVYGTPVTFSGRTTLLGFPVSLESREPDDEWGDVTTLTPGADGTFSGSYTPEIGASYRVTAAAGQLVSNRTKVAVKPRLDIRASSKRARANHRVRVTVTVEPEEDAVRTVQLMRSYDPKHPTQVRWKSLMSKAVDDEGVAVFTVRALAGKSLLRAQVSRLGLEPGYAAATSSVVAVTGVAPLGKKQK